MVHLNFCKDTDFSWLEQKLAGEKLEILMGKERCQINNNSSYLQTFATIFFDFSCILFAYRKIMALIWKVLP